MKKFFVTLLLVLLLGGAAFFLGWAQLAVPPGSWGLMRSKTHGLDKTLIRGGDFRWVWYKLIPANVEILVFTPERVDRTLVAQGELPSGALYAAFTGVTMDFSWEAAADFSFTIKPAALPALAERRNITGQEDLRVFSGELADEMQAFILRRLRAYAEEGDDPGDQIFPGGNFTGNTAEGGGNPPGFTGKLEGEVYGAFPDIENFSCRVRTVRFPDFILYRSIRGLYEEYLEKQREFLTGGITQSVELRLNSRLRFEELEKYGELLTRYPILLQYLALDPGNPAAGGPASP